MEIYSLDIFLLQAADILPVQALLHQQSVELLQSSLCLVQTVHNIIHSENCVTSKDLPDKNLFTSCQGHGSK